MFEVERTCGKPVHEEVMQKEASIYARLHRFDPELADAARRLPAGIRRSLLARTLRSTKTGLSPAPTAELRTALRFFGSRRRPISVGVWSLSARVQNLLYVIEALNMAQDRFLFLLVRAPVPAARLESRPELLFELHRRYFGRLPRRTAREDYEANVLEADYIEFATTVREDIGLDHLIGLTSQLVGAVSRKSFELDFTTMSRSPYGLVSTYYLEDVASEEGRPLAALVMWHVVAQILVDLHGPLEYHDDRGCMFDDNEEDMDGLPDAIASGVIEPVCERRIGTHHRDAAIMMARTLADYWTQGRRKAADTVVSKRRPAQPRRVRRLLTR